MSEFVIISSLKIIIILFYRINVKKGILSFVTAKKSDTFKKYLTGKGKKMFDVVSQIDGKL